MSREVMQQALDALAFIDRAVQGDEEMWPARGKWSYTRTRIADASVALRAALAAAQGEAVVSDKAVKAALKAYSDWRYNDNHSRMRAALVAASNDDTPPAAPQGEPVAFLYQHTRTHEVRVLMPGQIPDAPWQWVLACPLYAAPPAAPTNKEEK